MGRYRGGSKPWESGDSGGRTLDPHQYPELNAVFYGGDPAEYIRMRIEALSLMACGDAQLSPAFGSDRVIGNAKFGPMDPPAAEGRQRYIRMEAVTVTHHASESLLRLFFAHVDHEECPWLGMSASTAFPEFKKAVDNALKTGFDREQIATVFLGGTSPKDSCIQLTNNEFEDAVDGLELLLADCGNRCLDDSFLYNAVKHGATAVGIHDDDAQIVFVTNQGATNTLHEGPLHFYVHKKQFPAATMKRTIATMIAKPNAW
jgi:hypothetical protein